MEYFCPNCKKPIYDDEALLCLYCGEGLKRNVTFLGSFKSGPLSIVVAIITIVVIISFVLLVVF